MFKKKKEPLKQEFLQHDYTQTEKELYFLNLVLTRKKNITKEFLIGSFTTQQQETDYLRDEDIEDVVEKVVEEVYDELGSNYKEYLVKYYFGSLDNLLKFISEDVYVELVNDSINRNLKKLSKTLSRKAADVINKFNKG